MKNILSAMRGTNIWQVWQVSVMILVIGIELLKESALKVLQPTPVSFGWLSAGVLVAVHRRQAVDEPVQPTGSAFLIDSETLRATAADARNDVISTAAVLAASIAAKLSGIDRLDGLAGVGGSPVYPLQPASALCGIRWTRSLARRPTRR